MKRLAIVLIALLAFAPVVAEAKPSKNQAAKKAAKKKAAKKKAAAKKAAAKKAALKIGPSGLRFYTPSKAAYRGSPGSLVWQRPSASPVKINNAGINRHILYRSRSVAGKEIVVSGMLSIPKGTPPKGGWPVISWAHGTVGLADVCAPSRETGNLAFEYGHSPLNTALFEEWVDEGYAVLRTDYEGLGTPGPHPYLVGKSAARSLIDIVPAARETAQKLKNNLSGKVTLIGHSQGGHAVLFAAGMFNNYKKQGMTLNKTVSYAPASHLAEQGTVLLYANESTPGFGQPSSLSALATMIVAGATVANKDLSLSTILSESAAQFLPDLEKTCLPQLGAPSSLGGIAPYQLFRSKIGNEQLFETLEGMNPNINITTPVLILQGDTDTTVQPVFTNLLKNKLLGRGVPLDYQLIPGADHGSILSDGNDAAKSFLGY